MANRMRWRYGETNPVMAVPHENTAIETGDLLFYESDEPAMAASGLPDEGTLSGNQQLFSSRFLGVAMQASPAGESSPIRVATSGVFEFDIAPTTARLGDLLGPLEDSTGTALENQKVTKVSAVTSSIGRCAREESTNSGTVYVDIVSTIMRGGPQ